jgi:biotin transport system ATP-binding protein/energy-coupling factor transport system ATP-binding protein
VIRLQDVSFRYDPEAPPVLRSVTLEIRPGEYLALIGPNGSGKTTLIRHLNALLLPDNGTVAVEGHSTEDRAARREIRRRVGMVFQNPDHQIIGATVEEDVAFGPGNLELPAPEIRRRVQWALERVGIAHLASRPPHELSGGEKRLLNIAAVLAMAPAYIALDEPTAYLDPASRERVLRLLAGLHREGTAIIHIAHDMAELAAAGRTVILREGAVVRDGPTGEIFSSVAFLLEMGLAVPPITELLWLLKRQGWTLPVGLFSAAEAGRLIHQSGTGNRGAEHVALFADRPAAPPPDPPVIR